MLLLLLLTLRESGSALPWQPAPCHTAAGTMSHYCPARACTTRFRLDERSVWCSHLFVGYQNTPALFETASFRWNGGADTPVGMYFIGRMVWTLWCVMLSGGTCMVNVWLLGVGWFSGCVGTYWCSHS